MKEEERYRYLSGEEAVLENELMCKAPRVLEIKLTLKKDVMHDC